ncbi:ribosome silencing factor [Neisseria sp. Ec49-e6-T10]|uniref:ribosome silencing factor n=1 Tax=Neisseria sp. Ec49-e6-T10 TaxID=3140744 RepID=UPI003EBCFFE2
MNQDAINNVVHIAVTALEDVKGKDIMVLETENLTSLFYRLIVVTGDSNRQVKALARNAEEALKNAGVDIIGVEGMESGEWALVDAGDLLIHVMLPAVRDYYDIESLWGGEKPSSDSAAHKPWNPTIL